SCSFDRGNDTECCSVDNLVVSPRGRIHCVSTPAFCHLCSRRESCSCDTVDRKFGPEPDGVAGRERCSVVAGLGLFCAPYLQCGLFGGDRIWSFSARVDPLWLFVAACVVYLRRLCRRNDAYFRASCSL